MKTLDMRFIRYLNLFEKVTRVRTKNCFMYNNTLIFVTPREMISRAIGENGQNVRRLSEIIGRKIKVISFAQDNVYEFIERVVEPIRFKSIEISHDSIIINAGKQSKAALIGRNKARLDELNHIVKEYFNKELKII